jgi:uncharacterized membrane protein YtjA (UPF0391 family)
MIDRACISGLVALLTGVLGFGSFLDGSAKFVQVFSLVCFALCGISLLLALFEEEPEAPPLGQTGLDLSQAQKQPA